MNKRSHIEEMFIAEYISNGGNGKKAYMTVRPKAPMAIAKVNAGKMLKRPAVKRALQEVKSDKFDEAVARREHLIKEADEIGKDAYKKDKHGAALKAVETKAKLKHVYKDREPELMGWYQAIKKYNLTVINQYETKEAEAIDVPLEENNEENQ